MLDLNFQARMFLGCFLKPALEIGSANHMGGLPTLILALVQKGCLHSEYFPVLPCKSHSTLNKILHRIFI